MTQPFKPLDATATAGFKIDEVLNLEAEVGSPAEFAIKFITVVEQMIDTVDPHRRDWQPVMLKLKADAEKVLTP